MKWRQHLVKTLQKLKSRNIRVALSLIAITLVAVIVMTTFQMAKSLLYPNMTIWESELYTVVFTGIATPVIALFLILRFERLYEKLLRENEERRMAEKAFRESESRLRQFERVLLKSQEAGKVGSWYLDLRRNDLWWSPETYRMFGVPANTPLDYEAFLAIVHSDDRERVDRAWKEAVMGAPYDIEHRIVVNGEIKWVHEKAVLDYDEIGEPVSGIGTVLDITERKRSEVALEDAKNRAELYVDLMGHDINNMNQISLGFLELAQEVIESDGKLGPEHTGLLAKASESLKNSSLLIENVRKLQREKKGLYELKIIDIDEILLEAVNSFKALPSRNIKINYMPINVCRVKANDLIKDVFINLIGNAIKHSSGDLVINVMADSVLDKEENYCRVVVEDNGPGIPDSLKSTLFDRLSLDSTRASGKGFGLCLIKMLVDDYSGKFWVEDRVPGDHTKGAKFVVLLPSIEAMIRKAA